MRGSGPATTDTRRFRWLLLGCCLVGLVVRLGLGWHTSAEQVGSDTPFFRDGAAELVESGRYTESTSEGARTTAKHPPGFVLVLAAGELVGVDTIAGQRVLLALVGVAGVAFVGLAGFRLRGSVAGTVAAAIAAVHPMWLQPGTLIMSESLLLTAVAGTILMALVHLEHRTTITATASGAAAAAAVLVRSEVVLGLVLLAPVLVLLRGIGRRGVVRLAIGFGLGAVLVLGPWLVRNTVVAGSPVLSTNAGVTLAGSNCDRTYAGPNRGGFDLRCALGAAAAARFQASAPPGPEREVEADSAMRRTAIDHARAHQREAVGTAGVRVLRTWTPARLDAQRHLDTAEGRLPRWQSAGRWLHVLLLAPAALGTAVLLRSDRRRAAVLGVFVVEVTVVSALVYGSARVRTAAEPSIALLAGVGVAAAVGWTVGRARRRRPGPGTT